MGAKVVNKLVDAVSHIFALAVVGVDSFDPFSDERKKSYQPGEILENQLTWLSP